MLDVWHFINSDSGGAARTVENLVAAQAHLGLPSADRIRVTAPAGLRLPVSVRLDQYVADRRIWGLNQWRFAAYAWWQMQTNHAARVSLLHTHSFTFAAPDVHTVLGFYHAYWNRGFLPTAISAHRRLSLHWIQYSLLTVLERRVLKAAKEVVFASSQNREYAEAALNVRRPGHAHVILPGVDTSLYNPGRRARLASERQASFPELDCKRRWLLFVGHDFIGKGLLRLLRALAGRCQSGDWLLLVFGHDPRNLAAAQAEVNQACNDRVRFLGADRRLPTAFGLGDMLLMDSVSEGFPLVLLEAMAAGCVPVVNTFGGVSDVIDDGVNGFVRESAEEIVSQALSTDTDRLHEMSARSVQSGGARTWDIVAHEYAEVYKVVRGQRVS